MSTQTRNEKIFTPSHSIHTALSEEAGNLDGRRAEKQKISLVILAIIGLALATIGIVSLGGHESWWSAGALKDLPQFGAIAVITTGGVAVLLAIILRACLNRTHLKNELDQKNVHGALKKQPVANHGKNSSKATILSRESSYAQQLQVFSQKEIVEIMNKDTLHPVVQTQIFIRLNSDKTIQIKDENLSLTPEELNQWLTKTFNKADNDVSAMSYLIVIKTEHNYTYLHANRILRIDDSLFSRELNFEGFCSEESFKEFKLQALEPLTSLEINSRPLDLLDD